MVFFQVKFLNFFSRFEYGSLPAVKKNWFVQQSPGNSFFQGKTKLLIVAALYSVVLKPVPYR